MTNLFQNGAIDSCNGLWPIVKVIRKGLFPIIQLGIPILLILSRKSLMSSCSAKSIIPIKYKKSLYFSYNGLRYLNIDYL